MDQRTFHDSYFILRLWTATHVPLVAVSVGLGLRFVANQDVNEGEKLVNLSLEELRDERSRQVHGEGLHLRRVISKMVNHSVTLTRLRTLLLSAAC